MNGHPRLRGVHHVGVRTGDLANCVAWYRDFLGLRETWSTETFAELTIRRLPGMTRLTEVAAGAVRLHIFERAGDAGSAVTGSGPQFQHLCLAAGSASELRTLRQRWITLFESGAYRFARHDHATEVVVDDRGVESFYCLDVNGLELEFTYDPGGGP